MATSLLLIKHLATCCTCLIHDIPQQNSSAAAFRVIFLAKLRTMRVMLSYQRLNLCKIFSQTSSYTQMSAANYGCRLWLLSLIGSLFILIIGILTSFEPTIIAHLNILYSSVSFWFMSCFIHPKPHSKELMSSLLPHIVTGEQPGAASDSTRSIK